MIDYVKYLIWWAKNAERGTVLAWKLSAIFRLLITVIGCALYGLSAFVTNLIIMIGVLFVIAIIDLLAGNFDDYLYDENMKKHDK